MTKRNEPLVVCDAANRFTHHGGHPKLATCVNPRPVEASAPAAPPADLIIEQLRDGNFAAFLDETSESCIAIGLSKEDARSNGMRTLIARYKAAAPDAELRELRARREALEWACEATCGYCNPKNMLNLVGRFNDTNDHVGPEGEPYSCKAKNIHVELARIAAREKELEGRQ